MSAYLKEIANDVWKAVFWPLFAKTHNNRLFWMILLGIFTLVNTINVNSIWDIAFLVFFAFLFGLDWSAWWHRVDEEVDGFWYKELDIDQLMQERDEAVALLCDYSGYMGYKEWGNWRTAFLAKIGEISA